MSNFASFIDDCLQRSSYSGFELDLLERLVNSLPKRWLKDFIQDVYLDKLNLSGFGKSQFSLPSIRKYVDFFFKKDAKYKALKTVKQYKQNPISLDENIKKLIEKNIQINGDGQYLISELEHYFYNEITSCVKELI
ncbi:hypothetical protein N4T57_05950 [Campylobacter hepaticus]|uniref:hypothetical protein n=1 Tax=Campylobacter hepaticus TaxID=1813019 RepID=UPI0018C1967A|nr:hypothetical protein [Campylobacter hepaticus]MCZ0772678.1 hypothetical protein [Campylobacter hepaticus]MCZ0774146.1 hypothetical protein [Campylobacter hepaticus]MCZ0775398.1 hypothetical protein [Campylobacter hepaticus]MDX2323111.1 hypothetical protein [Campylobacter hepaticus]MDX2330821.1 hypothetical protein [Campylobacter hepaticus]